MWSAAVNRGYKTGNRNRKLTKLVKIVPYEYVITHANFSGDRTTLVKVIYIIKLSQQYTFSPIVKSNIVELD